MIIEELDLDNYLASQADVVAFFLVGRPPTATPYSFTNSANETKVGSISDIYVVRSDQVPVASGSVLTSEKLSDQLFLPIGINGRPRITSKPILSTERHNTVNVGFGGGGGN